MYTGHHGPRNYTPGKTQGLLQEQAKTLVGHRKEITVQIKEQPQTILLDTGAGTSLIAAHRARKLKLKIYRTSPVSITGVTSDDRVRCTEAAELEFHYKDQWFDIPVYVSNTIDRGIIIGNPRLESDTRLGRILNTVPVNSVVQDAERRSWPIGLTNKGEDRQVEETPGRTWRARKDPDTTSPIGVIRRDDE